MSKITPWISQGFPSSSSIGVRLLQDPLDRPVLVDHPVLVVERRVRLVGLLVLVPRAVDVLGVHVAAPRVVVAPARPRARCRPGRGSAGSRRSTSGPRRRGRGRRRPGCAPRGSGTWPPPRTAPRDRAGAPSSPRSVTTSRRVGCSDHADVDLDRERGAVRGPAHRVDARAGRSPPGGSAPPASRRLTDEFVAREPREGLGVAVREDDPAVVGGDDEALGRGLEQRAGLDRAGDGGGLGHGGVGSGASCRRASVSFVVMGRSSGGSRRSIDPIRGPT